MWAQVFVVLSQFTRLTDGRTDEHPDHDYRALRYMQSQCH